MSGSSSISNKDKIVIDLRKSNVFNSITNNNPFFDPDINQRNILASQTNSEMKSSEKERDKAFGIEYAISFCDYGAQVLDVVSSISLSNKLIGDIGLQLICQYLSYNRYPNLTEINFQDNLLSDFSLNTLSTLVISQKCYKLHLLNLTCNYINLSVGQLFAEFCSQHHITVQLGGCPDFSLASAVSASFPPTLFYRVAVQNDENSRSIDSLIYSNFCKVEEWCSMDQKPIVGVQLFYYGMGRIATQIVDTKGNRTFGDGECGNVVISTELLPVASVEFGCKDTPFSVLSYGSAYNGILTSLKLSLVANFFVCS